MKTAVVLAIFAFSGFELYAQSHECAQEADAFLAEFKRQDEAMVRDLELEGLMSIPILDQDEALYSIRLALLNGAFAYHVALENEPLYRYRERQEEDSILSYMYDGDRMAFWLAREQGGIRSIGTNDVFELNRIRFVLPTGDTEEGEEEYAMQRRLPSNDVQAHLRLNQTLLASGRGLSQFLESQSALVEDNGLIRFSGRGRLYDDNWGDFELKIDVNNGYIVRYLRFEMGNIWVQIETDGLIRNEDKSVAEHGVVTYADKVRVEVNFHSVGIAKAQSATEIAKFAKAIGAKPNRRVEDSRGGPGQMHSARYRNGEFVGELPIRQGSDHPTEGPGEASAAQRSEVELRYILIFAAMDGRDVARDRAKDLLRQIRASPEDFEMLAKRNSVAPEALRGRWISYRIEDLIPCMQSVVSKLVAGESIITEDDQGIWIIQKK